jgi:cytochrome c-type biogenesis protein
VAGAVIALEGNFAYSFLLGVLAAVNPCGFVLLPAYLMYFLGLEGAHPSPDQRAGVRRALIVSGATSAGFIAVFLVVGTISRLLTRWIEQQAKYAGFVIGLGLIVMGLAMVAGWKPQSALLQRRGTALAGERRDRTVRSMFLFGVAYAVASIGCSLAFLTTAIFGSIRTTGFVSGVFSIVLYGVGMSLLVMALTVTLAFAQGGLLRALRGAMRYLDRVAAVFILATGAYLAWYWWAAITERPGSDGLVGRIERWQAEVANFLQRQGAWRLAVVLGAVVAVGVVVATRRRQVNETS